MINFDDIKPKGTEEIPHKQAKDMLPNPMEGKTELPAPDNSKLNPADYAVAIKAVINEFILGILKGNVNKWVLIAGVLGLIAYVILGS
jgi:hypothetical protein